MITIFLLTITILQSFTMGILLSDYLKIHHPEIYEEVVLYIEFIYNKSKETAITSSYNAIYLYSKCQIMFNKYNPHLQKWLEPIIQKIVTHNNTKIDDIEFILDGNVVYRTTKDKMIEFYEDVANQPIQYDFIIYSDHSNVSNTNNNQITRKILKTRPSKESDFEYEKSDIKFMLCEFCVGDKKIKVDFKNDHSNYYVVNNKFDTKFLKYFLQKYYADYIENMNLNEIHDFKINIIDHNVDNIISDKDNIVKLSKNSYELVKNNGCEITTK